MSAPLRHDTLAASQRLAAAPPLELWRRTFAIFAAIILSLLALFTQVATPLPTDTDHKFFEAQLDGLDRRTAALEAAGERPLSLLFIGTSRLKNVAFDPADVARSARRVGIARPVVSSYLAVNWGGFERFAPAIRSIEERRPDVVVIMPELFFEDFHAVARAMLGFRFMQTRLWGQDFELFGESEFLEPVCNGFAEPIETRLADHEEWMGESRTSPGPELARDTVRALAEKGTLVIIADVPVSDRMKQLRPGIAEARFASQSGLTLSERVRMNWPAKPLDQSVYCDWAHIRPDRADRWREAFFRTAAADLARLQ